MDTLDIITGIKNKNKNIDKLIFTKYPKQTLIQNDGKLEKNDEYLLSKALDIREKYSLPFWDSLMLSTFDSSYVSMSLFERALKHNHNKEIFTTDDINEIKFYIGNNPDENLSLNSEVILNNGDKKHLFLLDFHIFPSDNNQEIVVKVLSAMDLHGYILNSGESYHFISENLYDQETLIDLLAKALLFSPIIDRAWIAHQLLERSCSLRVGKKHGKTPQATMKV